jgi:hypothetical protein
MRCICVMHFCLRCWTRPSLGDEGSGIATYDAFPLLLAGSCCNLKIDRWVVKWGSCAWGCGI